MKTVGGAINLNWAEQPEDLGCYLMQDKYEQLYNELQNYYNKVSENQSVLKKLMNYLMQIY